MVKFTPAPRPLMEAERAKEPSRVDPWITAGGPMGFHLEPDRVLIAEERAARAQDAERMREFHEDICDFNAMVRD